MIIKQHTPNIIDLAYQIITIHQENEYLKRELEHYKQLNELHLDSMEDRENNSKEITSILLTTVLDPNSIINEGHAAILKKRFNK